MSPAIHHQVFNVGTPEEYRVPVDPYPELDPIVFDGPPSKEGLEDDLCYAKEGITDCLAIFGLKPDWRFGPGVPCYDLGEAIEELRQAKEDAEYDAGYRPSKLERRWAEIHPAQAAEWEQRRNADRMRGHVS